MMNSIISHSNAEYGIIKTYEKPPRALETRREHDRSVKEISMHSISRTPSIYQIRHIESGRVYVGSAVDPHRRCCSHLNDLRNNVHRSRYLQNAWNKYGVDAFVFEIIEPVLFVEDLIAREQYWMDRLRATEDRHGFNIAPKAGSALGVKMSSEVRAKLSAARRARLAAPEERAKMSERARKRFEDPQERARLAEYRERSRTPEARARKIEAQKAIYADPAMREQAAAAARARFERDPSLRQRQSEIAQSQWSDPVYRKKVMDAHERKRQEKKARNT